MRLIAAFVITASVALFACAASPGGGGGSPQEGPSDNGDDSGAPKSTKKDPPPTTMVPAPMNAAPAMPAMMAPDSGVGTTASNVMDAGLVDAPVPAPHDGGTSLRDSAPPPNPNPQTGPGPECQALQDCCQEKSSLEEAACLLLVGKKSELLCAGGILTFSCGTNNDPGPGSGDDDGTTVVVLGPACGQLQACCAATPEISGDVECRSDWLTADESLCTSDLIDYQNDPFGDCL